MKKFPLLFFVLVHGFVFAQVGIGTITPDSNSVLEISSPDKGLLMPRVALTATDSPAPLTANVPGMSVYNTATSAIGPNQVVPGFYVNDGTRWLRLADEAIISATDETADEWVNSSGSVEIGGLSDGSVRPAGTEFVVLDNGNVGIGLPNPVENLQVNGSVSTLTEMGPGSYGGFYSGNNGLGLGFPATAMIAIPNPIFNPATDTFAAISVQNMGANMSFISDLLGPSGFNSSIGVGENSVNLSSHNEDSGVSNNLGFDTSGEGNIYMSSDNNTSTLNSNLSLNTNGSGNANLSVNDNTADKNSNLYLSTAGSGNANLSANDNTAGLNSNLSLNTNGSGNVNLSVNDNTANIYSNLSFDTNIGGNANIFAANDGTQVASRLTFDTGSNESVNLSANNNASIVNSGLNFDTQNDGNLNLFTNSSQYNSRLSFDNTALGKIDIYSGDNSNNYGSISWASDSHIQFSFNTSGVGGSYRFPRNNGAMGDVLVNDGFGNLNWESPFPAPQPWSDISSSPATITSTNINYMNGNVGIGVLVPKVKLEIGGTDAIKVPNGTSNQRPAPAFGMIRYNTDIGRGEMYVNDANGDGTQGDAGWRPI